jgi:glycosyltransferase involved in cell wall biosynthesis
LALQLYGWRGSIALEDAGRSLVFAATDSRLLVGIDAAGVIRPDTGIAQYTGGLVRALSRVAPEIELILFSNMCRWSTPSPVQSLPGRIVNPRIPARVLMAAWNGLGWPPIEAFVGKVDVFHASDWVTPPHRQAAIVATVHDVGALVEPGWYAADIVAIHRRRNAAVAKNAAEIITISQFTKEEYLRFHDIDPGRVHVVYNGVPPAFKPVDHAQARAVAASLDLDGPFLLYVGTRERRKNVRGLVEIFARVARRRPELALALVGMRPWAEAASAHGAERWDGREIEERIATLALQHRVRVLGHLPQESLVALYSAAEAFVFPSLYEGFGLPVLEAMACGLPVVASSRSAIPEVVGDAGLLSDPDDADGFAGEILHLVEDYQLRARCRTRGLERAAHFSWATSALATRDVYLRAAGRC